MINEKHNLPFDLYTRNKVISDLIDSSREKNRHFKILDIGGRSGYLKEFIKEEDELFILDIRDSELKEQNYFMGTITSAPFKDGLFDFVVSSDFYEHLSPNLRLIALSEMLRLTKNFIILAAPFYSEEVYDAELKANEFFRKLNDIDHMWLAEHIQNGLPKQEEIEKFLNDNSCNFYIIENNNILNWLLMQSFIFFAQNNPMTGVKMEDVFTFYNKNFLELGDSLPPTYRKIYFISKERIKNKINQHNNYKKISINTLKFEKLLSLTFLNIGEKVKEREEQFNTQINQLNIQINQLNNRIWSLETTIDSIYNSITWRTLMTFHRFLEKILPLGTKRRNYYDLVLNGIRVIIDKGLRTFLRKLNIFIKSVRLYPSREFEELNQIQIETIRDEAKNFKYMPKISIITPVWNPDEKWLRKAINSVINQIYTNWELCLADGNSKPEVQKILREYADKNDKIKVKFLSTNQGISGNSNEALSMATGEFVGLMDHDDEISVDALYEAVKLLNKSPDIDFIYSDEDKKELNGKRVDPLFKPDWSPDLLLFTNYLNHFTIIRKKLLDEIKGFRLDFDGSQDYDLYLRVTELTNRVAHIPKVLYHWRKAAGSAAAIPANKSYAHNNGKKAIIDALERRKVKANVEDEAMYRYRVKYEIIGKPKVAIIIPTKNKVKLLKNCIDSIEKKTDYKNYEILVVDNNSDDIETLEYLKSISNKHRILRYSKPFNFSDLNNWAVGYTDAEHLLFLNNDIEIISNEWLTAMLEHSQRKEIGAVGARQIHSDNTIQHAGIVLGVPKIIVGCAFWGHPANLPTYFWYGESIRDVSAVAASCVMMRRDVFKEVGGFDSNFAINHGDIDLCLRIRERGYYIVYTPYALLYHYESLTRGKENLKHIYKKDDDLFIRRWSESVEADPYFSSNMKSMT